MPTGAKRHFGQCGVEVFVGSTGQADFFRIPLHPVAKVQQ
jgi:hypothetical protein